MSICHKINHDKHKKKLAQVLENLVMSKKLTVINFNKFKQISFQISQFIQIKFLQIFGNPKDIKYLVIQG